MPAVAFPTDSYVGFRWLSAHLFFNGWIYDDVCDRVALEVAEPFVRYCESMGWIDGHFFIRYMDLAPHVRLRMRGDPAILERQVWPALRIHVASLFPEVRERLPDEMHSPPVRERALRVTHLARVAYEPEIERYGGADALRVAERNFELSSNTAYACLAQIGPERTSRLGMGLLSMLVLIHVFAGNGEHAVRFAQQYKDGYLRNLVASSGSTWSAWLNTFAKGFEQQSEILTMYVEEVWRRLDANEPLRSVLDAYVRGLEAVRDQLRKLHSDAPLTVRGVLVTSWEHLAVSIGSSYLHMMNNRLGITLGEESYLAYLTLRALGCASGVASV